MSIPSNYTLKTNSFTSQKHASTNMLWKPNDGCSDSNTDRHHSTGQIISHSSENHASFKIMWKPRAHRSPLTHLIKITVKPSNIRRYVNIYNVPVPQFPHVRDAMADALVHGGTHALREIVVVKWGGVRVPLQTCLMGL